jgi:hypothetical protein
MANIELPKDAEGREIPLDTEVLYDECGTKVSVKEFLSRTLVESQKNSWTIKAQYEGNLYYNSFKPKNMHLTQPDSWKRLKEDLRRTIGASDAVCAYFGGDNRDCAACRLDKESFTGIPYCNPCMAFTDILDRIRELRGEVK